MEEVTIKLNSKVINMLEDWRKTRMIELQSRIDLVSDEKVKAALYSIYDITQNADYAYLTEWFLKYKETYGGL